MNKQERLERAELIKVKAKEYKPIYKDWSRRIQVELNITNDIIWRALNSNTNKVTKKLFKQIEKDNATKENKKRRMKMTFLEIMHEQLPFQSKDKKVRRPKILTEDILSFWAECLTNCGFEVRDMRAELLS